MTLMNPYAYLVTYSLTQPLDKYNPLFDELKSSFKWSHYIESTWIVLRYETLAELSEKLRPLIFQPDRLLIMPAKGPADGWLPADGWQWINENVPREW